MKTFEEFEAIFKIAALVVGEMAGCLARRKTQRDNRRSWAARLRQAAAMLDGKEP